MAIELTGAQAADELLAQVVESAPVLALRLDSSAHVLWSGGGALHNLGLAPDAFIGERFYSLPCDGAAASAAIGRVLAGTPARVEFSCGGRLLEAVLEPLRDPAGEVEGAVCVALDVTEQRQQERVRLRHDRALATFAARAAAAGDNSTELAAVLARTAGEALQADWSSVSLMPEFVPGGLQRGWDVFGDGYDATLQQLPGFTNSLPVAEAVLASSGPVVINAHRDAEIRRRLPQPMADWLATHPPRETVFIRLVSHETPMGVLNVTRADCNPLGRFSSDELSLLQRLSGIASVSMRAALAHEQALASERLATERAAQQEALAALAGAALESVSVRSLLDLAVCIAAERLALPVVAVCACEQDGTGMMVKSARGAPSELVGSVIAPDRLPLIAEALHRGIPTGRDNLPEPAEIPGRSPNALLRSGCAVRIEGRTRPYGVLVGYDVRPRRFTAEELRFLHVAAQLIATALEQRQSAEDLRHQALHDPLTGLPNRTLLHDRLEVALARAAHGDGQVAALMLDLNRFKLLNDSRGHAAGDMLLRQVAARLRGALPAEHTVARLGGDEFVVVLEEPARMEPIQAAHHVQLALSEPFWLPVADDDTLPGGSADRDDEAPEAELAAVYASASIGIAVADREHPATAGELLRNADAAMYRAKEHGGGYELYDDDLRAEADRRLRLETAIREALRRDEFHLVYQPLAGRTGEPVAVEALLRWEQPPWPGVEPAEVVAVAEESALAGPLGAWVLDTACRTLAHWRDLDLAGPQYVSVNVSPRQLQEPGLVETVTETLQRHGLPPESLALEVTERVFIRDQVTSAETLSRLRQLGVRISLDDFGTGYSSLARLRTLPVDILKIDRSFMVDLPGRDSSVVSSVVALGHALELTVVAEGVETPAQANVLSRLGCDLLQGWHLGRPMPSDLIIDLYRPSAPPRQLRSASAITPA